jgi:hypothetical protein
LIVCYNNNNSNLNKQAKILQFAANPKEQGLWCLMTLSTKFVLDDIFTAVIGKIYFFIDKAQRIKIIFINVLIFKFLKVKFLSNFEVYFLGLHIHVQVINIYDQYNRDNRHSNMIIMYIHTLVKLSYRLLILQIFSLDAGGRSKSTTNITVTGRNVCKTTTCRISSVIFS